MALNDNDSQQGINTMNNAIAMIQQAYEQDISTSVMANQFLIGKDPLEAAMFLNNEVREQVQAGLNQECVVIVDQISRHIILNNL